MGPILAGALGGGLGGAAGALVGAGIAEVTQKITGKKLARPEKWATVIGLVFALVGGRLGQVILKPSIEEQLDKVNPVYVTLHKYYPEQYGQIILKLKASSGGTESAATVANDIRPLISSIISNNLQKISESNIATMFSNTLEEARYLRNASPQTCSSLLNGGTSGEDMQSLLPAALIQKDLSVSNDVLIQIALKPAASAPSLSAGEVQALAKAALHSLPDEEQKAVLPVFAAKRPPASDLESRSYCDFSIGLLQGALSDRPGTLKGLLAGAHAGQS